ncbi:hypothetical protein [Bacillus sp. FJAT-27445]|uniref:hypothetical protein n=1 Tax=Bacillus sp. FJAT-27445 TaxID=1679166 RepID=UPI0012E35C70|nr:hypothetical protein [Bacillus sp. FJAT-27445]
MVSRTWGFGFNGTLGQDKGGIFYRTTHNSTSLFLEAKSYLIPLLMFLFVVAIWKKLDSGSKALQERQSNLMMKSSIPTYEKAAHFF